LLAETGITQPEIRVEQTGNYKIFFQTPGDLKFDMLAASFYLISRYEEYLPHSKDEYGRYAHVNSLAFREGFLDVPLVNLWLQDLRNVIASKFQSTSLKKQSFTFLPSYDI